MGQGTESSETCADRPTEVSVIRFVSRNRTIEEIAPKKEVYICKQRGCGKIFTNQDDFKTHELLEALKIRFICREPDCGEELSDPGSMWRHYLEWHNNETSVFTCPYTSCSSEHATSEQLEEHIESCHRQLPTIPTEPEIICFEGSDKIIKDDITGEDNIRNNIKDSINNGIVRTNQYSTRNETINIKQSDFIKEEKRIINIKKEDYNTLEQSKLKAALTSNDCLKNRETVNRVGNKFPNSKNVIVMKDNYFETKPQVCTNENVQVDSSQNTNNTIFINRDVSITKHPIQEHRIELGDLEKVFRSGLERDSIRPKPEENSTETKNNCSEDEEYTPKKQRMSRNKQQELYKCEINGCGKTYKYISHFRYHQETHKNINNLVNSSKSKPKLGKTHITIYICKTPGCGAEMSNVNNLWKHYQETHANTKIPVSSKNSESFRCKIVGCDMEFTTSTMLCKHFNEVHSKNSINNTSTNVKTVNGSGVLVEQMFSEDTKTQ